MPVYFNLKTQLTFYHLRSRVHAAADDGGFGETRPICGGAKAHRNKGVVANTNFVVSFVANFVGAGEWSYACRKLGYVTPLQG